MNKEIQERLERNIVSVLTKMEKESDGTKRLALMNEYSNLREQLYAQDELDVKNRELDIRQAEVDNAKAEAKVENLGNWLNAGGRVVEAIVGAGASAWLIREIMSYEKMDIITTKAFGIFQRWIPGKK